jgi:hypothetical protein
VEAHDARVVIDAEIGEGRDGSGRGFGEPRLEKSGGAFQEFGIDFEALAGGAQETGSIPIEEPGGELQVLLGAVEVTLTKWRPRSSLLAAACAGVAENPPRFAVARGARPSRGLFEQGGPSLSFGGGRGSPDQVKERSLGREGNADAPPVVASAVLVDPDGTFLSGEAEVGLGDGEALA